MKIIPILFLQQWEKGAFFPTALNKGRKLIMNSMMNDE
jgi:hypothetical protein